jgi:hypothetical protein
LFPDEKATQQWMGGYYVTNIQFRIWRLSSFEPTISDMDELKRFLDKWAPFDKPFPSGHTVGTLDSAQFFDDSIRCLGEIVSRLKTLSAR